MTQKTPTNNNNDVLIRVSAVTRQRIKTLAALNNVPMTTYLAELINKEFKHANKTL